MYKKYECVRMSKYMILCETKTFVNVQILKNLSSMVVNKISNF